MAEQESKFELQAEEKARIEEIKFNLEIELASLSETLESERSSKNTFREDKEKVQEDRDRQIATLKHEILLKDERIKEMQSRVDKSQEAIKQLESTVDANMHSKEILEETIDNLKHR